MRVVQLAIEWAQIDTGQTQTGVACHWPNEMRISKVGRVAMRPSLMATIVGKDTPKPQTPRQDLLVANCNAIATYQTGESDQVMAAAESLVVRNGRDVWLAFIGIKERSMRIADIGCLFPPSMLKKSQQGMT